MLFILFHELPELWAVYVDKRFDSKIWWILTKLNAIHLERVQRPWLALKCELSRIN